MNRTLARLAAGLVATACAAGSASAQGTANLPDYLKAISGTTAPAPVDLATRNVLQLNVSMFGLYDNAGKVFRKNILDRHPLILALFSGAGGRMILYRPGQPPVDAPSVPRVYQVMKSLGHSTMAISEVVMPYLENAADKSWVAPMRAYLTEMKSALEGIDTRRHGGRLAAQLADHPREQHRLHGGVPRQGRDHYGRAAGIRQEAGRRPSSSPSTGRPRPRSSTGWA